MSTETLSPLLRAGAVEVLKPGLFTTIQDLGRPGYQRFGVSPGGAMDRFALRVANWLVGNEGNAAALEITLIGPELKFEADAIVAVGGASVRDLPSWQPIRVSAGQRLSLDALTSGCRAYLAVAGGIDVKPVLESSATYVRAHLGGWEGRALRAGDRLEWRPSSVSYLRWEHWRVGSDVLPHYSAAPAVRFVRGAQWDWFPAASRELLTSETFTLTRNSDRMGLRLAGPALVRTDTREMASEAVAFGSIQVPPDGQPIVLMAERQTLGGYPKIADVISVDLPVLAQLKPGDTVRFREVSGEEAEQRYLNNERALARLRKGLADLQQRG